jgi:hypothetical protein
MPLLPLDPRRIQFTPLNQVETMIAHFKVPRHSLLGDRGLLEARSEQDGSGDRHAILLSGCPSFVNGYTII